jgi:general stress protein 26
MTQDELGNHARSVIDSNRYMALGTADEAGHPWVSPVWFASEDYRDFHWVSSPDSKHRATVSEHWVLIPGRDPERGSGLDRSEQVSI